MPLEATHIKFALDLKDRYKIKSLAKYISGTIYPDSRYITKIDRNLTHCNKTQMSMYRKHNVDFVKGWSLHLACDKLCNDLTSKYLPNLFIDIDTSPESKETWIIRSAIKGIIDLEIARGFDAKPYLSLLEDPITPNGEDAEQILQFNKIIQDLYEEHELTVNKIAEMWLKLGCDKEIIEKVGIKTFEFMNNKSILKKICSIYPEMIKLQKESQDDSII